MTLCPASFFTFSLQLINYPLLDLWYLWLRKRCLDISKKDHNSKKRALRLIYVCKSKEHTVPFFLKSNCLPLPSLFFRDCSYLLYDINRQTAPVSILNQFVKTSQIHNYRTRSVSSDSFYVKFSRTDKMYAFFTRIGAQIWNSIPYSIKILKRSSFRKKIKELLLNFCGQKMIMSKSPVLLSYLIL